MTGFDFVSIALALGVALLSAALPPVARTFSLMPSRDLRRAWALLGVLILCFIAGYTVLIGLLPRSADPLLLHIIGVVLLLGGVFVLSVAQLSARTATGAARITHLERESLIDALTGTYNRRHMDAVLREHVGRSGRDYAGLALLMADLDHFKRVNDRHGHAVGDWALALAASILSRECRAGDVVARYGGEEFVILAPALEPAEARALAERMCRVLRETRMTLPSGGTLRLTMSVGIAVLREGECADAFLARADAALYAAKAAGRDRVVLAQPEAPEASRACLPEDARTGLELAPPRGQAASSK